jgi:hypothetical protein
MDDRADSSPSRTYLNNVLQNPGPYTDPDYDTSEGAVDRMASMKLLSARNILRRRTAADSTFLELCWLPALS